MDLNFISLGNKCVNSAVIEVCVAESVELMFLRQACAGLAVLCRFSFLADEGMKCRWKDGAEKLR